jgi:hypothetical protein
MLVPVMLVPAPGQVHYQQPPILPAPMFPGGTAVGGQLHVPGECGVIADADNAGNAHNIDNSDDDSGESLRTPPPKR